MLNVTMHTTSWQVTYSSIEVGSIDNQLLKASSSVESPVTGRAFDWRRLHFTQLTLKRLHTTMSPVSFSRMFNWPTAKPRGIQFQSVCLSVCLSDNNFQKPWRRKFISANPVKSPGNTCQVRIGRLQSQFQGHRSKKVENPNSYNTKLWLAITLVL